MTYLFINELNDLNMVERMMVLKVYIYIYQALGFDVGVTFGTLNNLLKQKI